MFANIAGLALVALIVWWFWLYKPAQTQLGKDDLVINVENGVYTPSHIQIPADKAIELKFMRKDPSPCAEQVLVPDMQISETLPLNKMKTLRLPPMKAGEYAFHCQMQMYRGTITVQ